MVTCPACGGSGQVADRDADGNLYYRLCKGCGGRGKV
jgi:DnaJ-class molecular chaperone